MSRAFVLAFDGSDSPGNAILWPDGHRVGEDARTAHFTEMVGRRISIIGIGQLAFLAVSVRHGVFKSPRCEVRKWVFFLKRQTLGLPRLVSGTSTAGLAGVYPAPHPNARIYPIDVLMPGFIDAGAQIRAGWRVVRSPGTWSAWSNVLCRCADPKAPA